LTTDVCHGRPELAATRLSGALQTALEALDAGAGVDELLLARIERVALRADLDVQLGLRRAGLERVTARARHRGDDVLGMDAGLHSPPKIAAACWGATLPPETTATTVSPARTRTLPLNNAAVPAAPPSSPASFVR